MGAAAAPAPTAPYEDVQGLYDQRQAYIAQWTRLEERLMSALDPAAPLYCFGAGGWTANIAGYCPDLWAKVVACAVDGGSGAEVQGKTVEDYAALSGRSLQFVIAVNPAIQQTLAVRLTSDGHKVLPWPSAIAV